MNSDISPDSAFLRRWQRWHRLGWFVYLLYSLAVSTTLTAASIFLVRNLFEHGATLAAWHALTPHEYFFVAGAVFASVSIFLGRFSSNETRYHRLIHSGRND